MSLGFKIKKYLHTINDGAFAKDLRKTLNVEHSDIMAALMELGHEVIQGEDDRWYLDVCAKLDEPESEPVIEPPIAAEAPIIEKSATAKRTSKMDLVLDVLRQKHQEGAGPYTYAQFAQILNEELVYVRGLKKNITKYRPEELPLWDSMIIVQDILKNLKNGPRETYQDLGLGAYRWRRLRNWLAEEQVSGRGPYLAKEICGRWCSVASLRQTQRAITALRQQGSEEDKKLAEQMIVYANPAFKKPAVPDKTAILAALDDVRLKIIPKTHPLAERWRTVCEGLDKIIEDLGLGADHLTRADLQGMAEFFREMSDQISSQKLDVSC